MYQFLFRNKWAALAFVVLTLASVQYLVGREGEDSAISRTQDNLISQRDTIQRSMDDMGLEPDRSRGFDMPEGARESDSQPMDFTPDEDLIDDASGFDPTPDEEYFYEDGPTDPTPQEESNDF